MIFVTRFLLDSFEGDHMFNCSSLKDVISNSHYMESVL